MYTKINTQCLFSAKLHGGGGAGRGGGEQPEVKPIPDAVALNLFESMTRQFFFWAPAAQRSVSPQCMPVAHMCTLAHPFPPAISHPPFPPAISTMTNRKIVATERKRLAFPLQSPQTRAILPFLVTTHYIPSAPAMPDALWLGASCLPYFKDWLLPSHALGLELMPPSRQHLYSCYLQAWAP